MPPVITQPQSLVPEYPHLSFLPKEIAHALQDILNAEGVGVVMDARHLCMQMRGVEKQNSVMTTSSMLGSFRRELATRNEFTRLIR